MNHGEIPSFDASYFLLTAQILVDADEAERAYWLLTDGLPAFYRQHTPERIVQFRNKIQMAMMTPLAYGDCKDDSLYCENDDRALEILSGTLRGQLTLQSVLQFNERGIRPHIVEIGPGEFWLPRGLRAKDCAFTYQDIGINEYTKAKSKEIERSDWDEIQPVIFCAQEVIEHMASPSDLGVELMRATNGKGASEVHLSTPLFTYDGKPKPILELGRNGLPHLRAYTPNEFIQEAMKIFGPSYQWAFYPSQVMSLVGKRI